MGYRLRLGKIPKRMKDFCEGKSFDELLEICGDQSVVYGLPDYEQIYELGKYFDFKDGMSDFFSFDILEESECEFKIVSKDGLKKIIGYYHKQTLEYHEKLLKEMESGGEFPITLSYLSQKVLEWSDNAFDVKPYYLDEENTDGFIVRSLSMEYGIFNLVFIYKTFNWENDYLIYSGW